MTDEPILLMQILDRATNKPRVARVTAQGIQLSKTRISTLDLAKSALSMSRSLADVIALVSWDTPMPQAEVLTKFTLLAPVTHDDPTHLHASGTGLTHLSSADSRDQIHDADADTMDSMRMFKEGVKGGRPLGHAPGVQPEWFYKGNGHNMVAPEQPIVSPDFALDAGEEPELAGIYLIDRDRTPIRLGYTLVNDCSDHALQKQNCHLLAHSRLRPFSIGPALRVGLLPTDISGNSRVMRGDKCVWSKAFRTGEANMSHSLANLEHHHFKYRQFRQPGDVHIHMFGTSAMSFVDGFRCQDGDTFEIEADGFGPALRNTLDWQRNPIIRRIKVHSL